MQKLWQKKLKLSYRKEVIDIIQFGSSVMDGRENPNDVDIAVIFQKISLKEQLDEAQKIKKQLEKNSEIPVHINSFDMQSLFEPSNFAREGILFYGRSLITKSYFSEYFNFIPKIQIIYSLNLLKKKDKVRFHYMLRGKAGKYGLLRRYSGKLISPGVIEVPPEYENIFIHSIKEITKDFEVKKVFHMK